MSPHDREPPRPAALAALRRRGWIVPLVTAIAAVTAYAVAESRPVVHEAEAVVIVGSGAGREGPGQANDATTLARTYAGTIPEDERVMRAVARAAGREPASIEDDLTVANDTGTSLLRLRYSDAEPDRAVDGARALATAVVDAPRRPALGRGSVREVRLPGAATRTGGDSSRAVPIGIALGLLLGLLLLLGWERSDRRVDDEDGLRAEVGSGVSDLRRTTPATLSALLGRWRELGGASPRIAAIPADRRSRRATERLAGELRALGARVEAGEREADEAAALAADVVVLVSARGASARAVRRSVTALEQLGRAPAWAVLTRRRGPAVRGEAAPAGAAGPSANGARRDVGGRRPDDRVRDHEPAGDRG